MYLFREHRESMIKLRKLLSHSSKARRHRRNILNFQITVLAWITEFLGVSSFLLGSFIIGHTNTTATFILQTLSAVFNFILLPSILSINNSSMKRAIEDSVWYQTLIDRISPMPDDEEEEDKEDEDDPE